MSVPIVPRQHFWSSAHASRMTLKIIFANSRAAAPQKSTFANSSNFLKFVLLAAHTPSLTWAPRHVNLYSVTLALLTLFSGLLLLSTQNRLPPLSGFPSPFSQVIIAHLLIFASIDCKNLPSRTHKI